MAEGDGQLLLVQVETSDQFWTNSSQRGHIISLKSTLQQLVVFIQTFELFHEENMIVLLAAGDTDSCILYASEQLGSLLGWHQDTTLAAPDQIIRSLEEWKPADHKEGLEKPAVSATLSRALCLLHKARATPATNKLLPRILCLHGSPDAASQYIAIMNCIFSAQRNNVVLDTCMLGSDNSAFLQQAAHLSGGIYLQQGSPPVLLQTLLTIFASSIHMRTFLRSPEQAGVDFRASCFCHKNLIDLGFVCSVCLSIFCQHQLECPTCGTVYGSSAGPSTMRNTAH
ncbi:hypothetical protein WJX74_009570 [Apatococcus lobatus]|uniref:General transcription and DNA repair factor IIH subunit TFB4 n=2 Tax=Apatococcus TaxID=904362 RepID=A0AAW1TAZ1_9CHLO